MINWIFRLLAIALLVIPSIASAAVIKEQLDNSGAEIKPLTGNPPYTYLITSFQLPSDTIFTDGFTSFGLVLDMGMSNGTIPVVNTNPYMAICMQPDCTGGNIGFFYPIGGADLQPTPNFSTSTTPQNTTIHVWSPRMIGATTTASTYYLVLIDGNNSGYSHGLLKTASDNTTPYFQLYTASTTIQSDATRIDSMQPDDFSTYATSTPIAIGATGYVNAADAIDSGDAYGDKGLEVLFHVFCIYPIDCSYDETFTTYPIIVGTSSQPWYVSTLIPSLPEGSYGIHATLFKPKPLLGFINNLFGVVQGDYLAQFPGRDGTYTFTVGTTTPLQDSILQGRRDWSQTQNSLSSTSPDVCIPIPGIFNAGDCVKYLFIPDTLPNFGSQWQAIQNKPPFGYFNIVSGLFTNATTTTASTTPSGLTMLGSVFTPIRDIIALLLWLLFAVWIFKRGSHFNFQS